MFLSKRVPKRPGGRELLMNTPRWLINCPILTCASETVRQARLVLLGYGSGPAKGNSWDATPDEGVAVKAETNMAWYIRSGVPLTGDVFYDS